MIGKIHSIESFGTVDGPGIRFVTFMQGCPLRCLYCHNPDTWETTGNAPLEYTPQQLMEEVLRYKSFIAKGGVTLTGGEPLIQPQFVKEFFALCRTNGIHTALDTSGHVFSNKTKEALDATDLVLLDIKTLREDFHEKLTGVKRDNTIQTLNYLEEKQIPVWIRHVVVPGLTDDAADLDELARFLARYKCVEKVELHPYHTMGVMKYEAMGIPYPLADTPALTKEQLDQAKAIFAAQGLPL